MAGTSHPSAQIRLLGGVRVEASGRPADPLPRKCQELLAALALDPQTAITVARLVDLLWGEDPPRTAEKTLQTYVARLRKVLGPTAITRTGSAYLLDVDPAAIDTFRFRAALRRGDIEAALHEWTGAPLAGIEGSGLRPLLDGLTEEWLDAVEADLENQVESDPGAVTGRLTELVADHPFREGIWALLMTALYRTNRQAEALDAYRRARATLIDELGVEPGPRLQDLEQLILRHDDQLSLGTRPRRQRQAVPTGTVTFGFVELSDVPALWSDHPAHAADILAAFEAIAQRVAGDSRGIVFTASAEAVGVAFDSATDATTWSFEMRRAVLESRWPHGQALGVRIGLHTGEADERNGSYYGPSVTAASRVASLASPGQTVATSITTRLAGSTTHSDLGTYTPEGISEELELHQIGPGSFPPLRITERRNTRLPRPANRLIGRDHLVSTINDALSRAPIVTLVGPGGIGKTRLAIEVIRRNQALPADRVWFVSLAEVTEPTDVERALADTIGVRESSEQSVLDAVTRALHSRPALVMLDNCEHLVGGVGDLVSTITERCPDLTVLTTSREGLGAPAEQLIPVGTLDIEAASIDLFVERAVAVDREFDAEAHRATVQAICRRLDGVPLAIELAAARVRALTPAELLERLDDSFRHLTGARRGTLERHRTLQATMRWSYDLLSEPEQLLFRRLSIFSGPFNLVAAERVIPDERLPAATISALIGDLIDRSMCIVESGISGRRFRLLEPMRQFALEELRLEPSDGELRQRHADHVRDQVRRIHLLLAGPDEVEGAAELDELWPNLRSAFDWAIDQNDPRLGADLVGPVLSQGFLRRGFGELSDWIERLVEVAGSNDRDTVADGLLWTALYAQLTEDRTSFDRLVDRFGEANTTLAALARAVIDGNRQNVLAVAPGASEEALRRGDTILAGLIEVLVGGNMLRAGQLDETEAYITTVIQRGEHDMPPTLLNWLLYMAANLRTLRGDTGGADVLYDRIVDMRLPSFANSPNQTLAARRAMRMGDQEGAYEILRQHIDELRAGSNLNGSIVVAFEFVHIMIATDHISEAAFILGYSHASGIAEVDNFRSLLDQPSAVVAKDPAAAEIQRDSAARHISTGDALDYMASTLDALLGTR